MSGSPAPGVPGSGVAPTWRRVEPAYVWIALASSVVPAVVVTGVSAIPWLASHRPEFALLPAAAAVASVIALALTPRRVRAIGYALRADDLIVTRGIMWRRTVAVPYGRMQLVDVVRGPIARALGLAELKFVTAAAATAVTIPGLRDSDAEALRDRLVELAETRRAGL